MADTLEILPQSGGDKHTDELSPPFTTSMLTMRVILAIAEIGKNIKEIIQKKVAHRVEGRCIADGYIMRKTVHVVSISSGKVEGNNIVFTVLYKCEVCLPIQGMLLQCSVKSITNAGITAMYTHDGTDVVTVYISRDLNYDNEKFNSVKEGQSIVTSIIANRYELNDTTVCCLGSLV